MRHEYKSEIIVGNSLFFSSFPASSQRRHCDTLSFLNAGSLDGKLLQSYLSSGPTFNLISELPLVYFEGRKKTLQHRKQAGRKCL